MADIDYTLTTSAAYVATETSASKDFSGSATASFYLIVGTVSGTTPTLDVLIQDSPDGTNWFTLATFTQVVASTNLQVQRVTNIGRYVRAVGTIAGTTPSFTYSVLANGHS